jgi:antitoxin ParD1/3/4
MRSTQQLSITLPNEMADLIRAKVATGEYATVAFPMLFSIG